jgi:hypothetical protein
VSCRKCRAQSAAGGIAIQYDALSLAEDGGDGTILAYVLTLNHIQRLSDEGGSYLVDVRCVCGYSALLDPLELARRYGPDTLLVALEPRMLCSSCNRKGARVRAVPKPRTRGAPKNPH